jgi:crotonobetainyl-CoA:carnitine CoA-transferase CaiB-like acyl-CoA transferase
VTATTAGARRTALLPSGTKVVELGERVSTAVCGRFLERLGATVTCVLPAGLTSELNGLSPRIGEGEDERSATAEWLRANKTLLNVDLTNREERERLNMLVADADVVLIAGTTAEWADLGIPLDHLTTLAPAAVIGQVTPWGDFGPYTRLRGGELLAQAAGGLMNIIGLAEREPVRLGGHPMQAATGMLALDGVLIGLFHRQNTGKGSRFTTSEFESVAHVEWKIASAVQAGRPKERRGDEGGGPTTSRTRDGHFGLFFVPRNWAEVKAILGDPRLDDERFATPKARAEHQEEFTAIVEEITRSLSKKDLYYQAQARNVPAGHVATMSDLLKSPQYRARNFFQPIELDGIGLGEIPDAPWQVLTADDREPEGKLT